MGVTTDEALLINAEVLRRAKGRGGNSNHYQWEGQRCALCAYELQEGQEFISFIPMDYKDYKRVDTSVIHVKCLDFKDRNSYNYNKKTATGERRNYPLLTNDVIYDIIQGKETDANSD